ncbi:unnamed protein product [Symbiodinium sp. CCMP2592]|nr:unnamed protein product [Symbiodinium sp. CCMP2592]
MRAKCSRLCERTKTGKLQVSEEIHKMWLQKGVVRDNLIQFMTDAEGNREEFIRKVEVWKETQKFRETMTHGGFYSEADMKKPVAEGGLGLKEFLGFFYIMKNKYDKEETEYWVDHRTSGVRGMRESEHIKDSTSAQGSVQGMEESAKPGGLDEWRLDDLGTCEVESGVDKVAESILRHMQESVACRDKLSKFVEKLDVSAKKMNDVIVALGGLYDELAKLQADAKIQKFSDAQTRDLENKCEAVKRQMTMAASLEVKNKKLKKKTTPKRSPEHSKGEAPQMNSTPNPKPKKRGKKIARAIHKLRMETGGESLAIYKIGITHDYEDRFQLYRKNGWTKMLIMFQSSDLGSVEMLEAALISHHAHLQQCRNVLRGGEGMRDKTFNPKFATAKHVATIAKAFAGDISSCKALKDLARAPLNDAEKSLQAVVKRSSRLAEFWEHFRGEQPTHEVFDHGHFIDYSCLVPLYVHGDGGRTYKRDELMVIQFQPVLGFGSRLSHPLGQKTGINLQGHSFTTRFLIGVMPKQMYRDALDVFDAFMVEAMRSLESLYYEGLQLLDGRVLRFLVVGLKGDLPFLAKAGHLNRTFLNVRKAPERPSSKPLVGCCWMCGAGSPNIPFEEFGKHPRWLSTCGANNALPWNTMPPLFNHVPAHVQEDRGSFFKLDVLHIYHLGVGRDFAGSSLTVLLEQVYQGDTLPEKLQAMNDDLKRFCASTGKQVHFKQLTRELLGCASNNKYPTGHWNKASDTPTLVGFVLWVLEQHAADVAQSRMLQVMSSASEAVGCFMRELLRAPLWLSPEQAQRAGEASLHFLQCYAKLVHIFYTKGECKYNLVPKLHNMHHLSLGLLDSASKGQSATNPLSYACFQDEDFIGRVSRLSRRISPKLLVRRTVERYLIATKYQLEDSKTACGSGS